MSHCQPAPGEINVPSPSIAADALHLLASRTVAGKQKFRKYSTARPEYDSDDENDSACPVFDAFYEPVGNKRSHTMCHFDGPQFRKLCNGFSTKVCDTHNVGPGRKYVCNGMDLLLMALVVLKCGTQWDIAAHFLIQKVQISKKWLLSLSMGYGSL